MQLGEGEGQDDSVEIDFFPVLGDYFDISQIPSATILVYGLKQNRLLVQELEIETISAHTDFSETTDLI